MGFAENENQLKMKEQCGGMDKGRGLLYILTYSNY
jgi:hypothetical protein